MFIEKLIPGFMGFDEKGNVLPGEMMEMEERKSIAAVVWRGIKEQVINDHVCCKVPLTA